VKLAWMPNKVQLYLHTNSEWREKLQRHDRMESGGGILRWGPSGILVGCLQDDRRFGFRDGV